MKQETKEALQAALSGLEEEMRCDNGATPDIEAARQCLHDARLPHTMI